MGGFLGPAPETPPVLNWMPPGVAASGWRLAAERAVVIATRLGLAANAAALAWIAWELYKLYFDPGRSSGPGGKVLVDRTEAGRPSVPVGFSLIWEGGPDPNYDYVVPVDGDGRVFKNGVSSSDYNHITRAGFTYLATDTPFVPESVPYPLYTNEYQQNVDFDWFEVLRKWHYTGEGTGTFQEVNLDTPLEWPLRPAGQWHIGIPSPQTFPSIAPDLLPAPETDIVLPAPLRTRFDVGDPLDPLAEPQPAGQLGGDPPVAVSDLGPGDYYLPDIILRAEERPTLSDGTTHQLSPPPERTKERKAKARNKGVVWRIVGAAGETGDFIRALHDALPPWAKRSRAWRDKDGKLRRRKADSMLRDLWDHWDELDIEQAIHNVLDNELQDRVIGKINQRVNRATETLLGTGYKGQGVSTRIQKLQEAGESRGGWPDLIPQFNAEYDAGHLSLGEVAHFFGFNTRKVSDK